MSFPQRLQDTFTPSEIQFLAENQEIEVISSVNMKEKLNLITTELPKLRHMTSYKIPLWLAVILRKQKKVSIVAPRWLNKDYLTEKYQEEIENPTIFGKLPDNWLEISKIFLKNFHQDLVDDEDSILRILQDLKEIRLVKLRKGLNNLNDINLGLNDLSLIEINEFRPFIIKVMGSLNKLQSAVEPDETPDNFDLDDNFGTAHIDDAQLNSIGSNKQDMTQSDVQDVDDITMSGIVDEFQL